MSTLCNCLALHNLPRCPFPASGMPLFLLSFRQPTELIAGKCYFKGGVILHTVFFSGSLYCVLADANDDQPLLDVAFPDVTARCRGCVVECVCVHAHIRAVPVWCMGAW